MSIALVLITGRSFPGTASHDHYGPERSFSGIANDILVRINGVVSRRPAFHSDTLVIHTRKYRDSFEKLDVVR